MKVRKPIGLVKAGIGDILTYWVTIALLISSINVFAQSKHINVELPYDRFEREWAEYCLSSNSEIGILRRYFHDTISVDEMIDKFYANYNHKKQVSPYWGLDSVVYGIRGEHALLTSPLQRNSMKVLHGKRGIWKWGKCFYLHKIVDKDGIVQDKLLRRMKKKRDSLAWLKGDFVTLRAPRHYMGFVVSPRPYLQTYDERQMIGTSGNLECPADYFSYAGPTYIMDGEWYHKIRGGAEYLSRLLTLYAGLSDKNAEEKTFTVLLYMSSKSRWMKREYTLKILLPSNADEETMRAFERMKLFIERLKPNAFNPLYTTDFRIMTGRFYRVTFNKCGWLVEDYLDLYN